MENEFGFSKKDLLLYAITPENIPADRLCRAVESAIRGGATIIQYREKSLGFEEQLYTATKLAELCHSFSVKLIVNDSPEIAVKSGADGVHVGLSDMSVKEIREKYKSDLIVGATAKTVTQAKAAEEQGADYIGVGAVFPSPTKTDAIRITNEQLREITSSVKIPAAAIGGITAQNALSLAGSGISGIAVVSAIFGADDIEKSAKVLKEIARKVVK